MDIEQMSKSISKLGALMGLDEDKLYNESKVRVTDIAKANANNELEKVKKSFENGTIDDRHRNIIDFCKKTLHTFKNCDQVECDISLINGDMTNVMWRNIDVFSYDIETFFLNKFEFLLKNKDELMYRMYFSIEEGSVFLYVENINQNPIVAGTIIIKDGKFIPYGAIGDIYLPFFQKQCIKDGLKADREHVGNITILNCLLYILIVNQMVNQNREVITETSKRINVPPKNNKKKKKKPKKTVQIKYIKVDAQKIKKIREEKEREERLSYERHTDSWSRRGYWTTLRNGKKHWVKPTTCYAKDKVGEKVQKLYKLK